MRGYVALRDQMLDIHDMGLSRGIRKGFVEIHPGYSLQTIDTVHKWAEEDAGRS